MGQPMRGMAIATDGRLGRDQGVGDGLLRRLDGRPEERADGLVVELANGSFELTPHRSVTAAQIAIARREGEEDVAALVLAGTTAARHAQAGALREPFTLMRQEWRVGGQDGDDRTVPESPAACVAQSEGTSSKPISRPTGTPSIARRARRP